LRDGLLGKRHREIKDHRLFDPSFVTLIAWGVQKMQGKNTTNERYRVDCLIAPHACRNDPWYSHPNPQMPYSDSDAGKFTSRISASAAGSFQDQ
jgi:hypothetical protein